MALSSLRTGNSYIGRQMVFICKFSRSYKKDYNGLSCRECGGMYHNAPLLKHHKTIWNTIVIVLGIGALCLTFIDPVFTPLFVLLIFLIDLVIMPFVTLFLPVLAYDREESQLLTPNPNAVVTVAETTKLRKLMIYGVEVKNAGNDSQLTKCFDQGVFAAMFLHSEQSDPCRWHVYIIKKELIPEQVLESGSEFTLTFQGKVVGTGAFV